VVHLPGWYAQKHPDEDWAETFAVWMTPGGDWRTRYAGWPEALAKLEYCDRLTRRLGDQEPAVAAFGQDEDVGSLDYSVAEHYRDWAMPVEAVDLPGLDGALQAIFEDLGEPEDPAGARRLPAAELIRKWERTIQADVYRWTGHFPERTRALLRHLAERSAALGQVYPADREAQALLGLSTLVTALAMNHVHRGTYLPEK
jgi:hypothetical protein